MTEFDEEWASKRVSGLVSVVIPAFNGADFLREAIQNVVEQTYRPVEVIVVDDGSSDHTRSVCEAFGEIVRYIYKENDGSRGCEARVRAITESRGEWIALLDQDDRWLPSKLGCQVSAMTQNPALGASLTGVRYIDQHGNSRSKTTLDLPSGYVYHPILSLDVPYTASSALIRRDSLIGWEPRYRRGGFKKPGDLALFLHLSKTSDFDFQNEVLTEYRIHETNMSRDHYLLGKEGNELLENWIREQPLQGFRCPEGCRDCVRSAFRGQQRVQQWVTFGAADRFHRFALNGQLSKALPSLWEVLRYRPTFLLHPRRLAAIAKNLLLCPLRGIIPYRYTRYAAMTYSLGSNDP